MLAGNLRGPRVVIDTNVLVSGLAYPSGAPARILRAVLTGKIALISSRFIADETIRVLPLPAIPDESSGSFRIALPAA